MEIKGIDVSAYQGNIDWKTVADYGMGFAILRITEKGNVIDSTFERNYEGCVNNNIPVGVYKYSYAMSVAEIQKEAQKVVDVLDGRKLDFPVWLDLEHPDQRNLSKSTLETMIKTFWSVVKAAGYKFGIYSNADWYNNVIPESAKSKYDFWIARYPANDDGWLQERLRPDFGVGWQYSSKAKIPGIEGYVDRDVFYKDYKEGETVAKDLWAQTAELMAAQSGYLEKASNYNLDSKTGNAGSNNFTKYSRDVDNLGLPGCQGQPWCATYQFWICWKIFGKEKALDIMGSGFYNCASVKNHAKSKSTWHGRTEPKLGALVIFRNSAHIGRVTRMTNAQIFTNEGNTSKAGGVIPNGGEVADKVYRRNDTAIDGYVWIDYTGSGSAEESKPSSKPGRSGYMFNPEIVQKGSTGTSVLLLQEILRARGFKGKDGKELGLDRSAGENTIYALKSYQKSRNGFLEVDGIAGTATWKDLIAIE